MNFHMKIAIFIGVFSLLIIYFYPHLMNQSLSLANTLLYMKSLTNPSSVNRPSECLNDGEKLFTKEELSKYDGTGQSLGLYLAFLGIVYDVSKGAVHYRPGGSYAFFAGKDATRAFITGEFNSEGLIDDLDGVDDDGFDGVKTWIDLYEKDYTRVGRVIGAYYDASGCPTSKLEWVNRMIQQYNEKKMAEDDESKVFPYCNSEWTESTKSGRVWCSKMSGGIERDWVGVPRQLFMPEAKRYRCACIKDFGPPTETHIEYVDDEETNINDNNLDAESDIGDLANPRLKQYEGCDPKSFQCKMSD